MASLSCTSKQYSHILHIQQDVWKIAIYFVFMSCHVMCYFILFYFFFRLRLIFRVLNNHTITSEKTLLGAKLLVCDGNDTRAESCK